MPYTFVPKENYARAYREAQKVSRKNLEILCRQVSKRPLSKGKKFLENMANGKIKMDGKTYDNAVLELINIIESCEKNAEHKGLNSEKLFLHASVHTGRHIRRRRRKQGYGNQIKTANVEIMLIEKGSIRKDNEEVKKEENIEKEIKKEESTKKEVKKDSKENESKEIDKSNKEEVKETSKEVIAEVKETPKEVIVEPKKELSKEPEKKEDKIKSSKKEDKK